MILLDSHSLLWYLGDRAKLSGRATDAIARASRILICTYTFFEIATLVRRGGVRLDRGVFDWIRDLFEDGRFHEAPVSWSIAAAGGALGERFPGDPADRLIYATARDLAIPLVTKDRRIREFAREARDVRVIW